MVSERIISKAQLAHQHHALMFDLYDYKYEGETMSRRSNECKKPFPHGKGKLVDAEGNVVYEGDFLYGIMDGYGIYYGLNTNNVRCKFYEGQFKYGKYNGKGKLFDEFGKCVYSGIFRRGEPLDSVWKRVVCFCF